MAFPDVVKELASAKDVLVSIHVNPDGDAFGSLLGMTRLLQKLGKRVVPVSTDVVTHRYSFLPGIDQIVNVETARGMGPFDTAVILDSGDFDRIGDVTELVTDGMKVINIDHHESNPAFGDAHWVDTEASAVCEMLVPLYRELGVEIDRESALMLYTGIATDTGIFRFSNASSKAFATAAMLVELGANPALVAREAVISTGYEELRVLGKVIDRMETHSGNRIVISHLIPEEEGTDTEGFIDYLTAIETAEVAILLRPIGENQWKASMRSTGDVNVAIIGAQFNGGGHAKAAGGSVQAPIDDAKRQFVDAALRALASLDGDE